MNLLSIAPSARCALISTSLALSAGMAMAQATGDKKTPEITDIKDLLVDGASGHVSAASLLGLGSDAVTTVENPRGLVGVLKNLGSAGTTVGVAFAPARTSFVPMSLATYGKGVAWRLLGNTTFSYAQGSAKVGDKDVARRAFSIETSTVFSDADDPVLIALKDRPGSPACRWQAPISPPGTEPDFEPANTKYSKCIADRLKVLSKKWNVSQASFSIATGSAKPEGGTSFSLGRTMAAGLVYGFDHMGSAMLKDGAALSLTWRRSIDAPLLDSLASGTLQRKSSNLFAARLSGGSDTFRMLLEGSRLRETEVGATQRMFKHAIGFDLRLAEGMWLTLRSGKLRKNVGGGDETATLMDLSYSPKSELP